MEQLKGGSIGKAPAFLANIRLDRKGLPKTNTNLLRKFVNTDKTGFIRFGPGGKAIKKLRPYKNMSARKLVNSIF